MTPERAGGLPRLLVHGLPEDSAGARAAELLDLGFEAVVLPPTSAAIETAHAAGLRVFVCTGTFTVAPDEVDLLAVDVDGVPRRWFNSGCPNHPELRARHLERVRAALSRPAVAGFYLDGIRFASPAAGPDAFLTCFCESCAGSASAQGFDFARMRSQVRSFGTEILRSLAGLERLSTPPDLASVLAELPGVADWLAFRAACVESHVREVAAVVRAAPGRKLLGGYLFTLAFATLVGQSYRRLAPHLDVVSPMVYRNGTGDSVLTAETLALGSWVQAGSGEPERRALRAVLGLYGLDRASRIRSFGGLRRGFAPSVVGHQVRAASGRLGGGEALAPIVRLDDPRLEETVRRARGAGAAGLSFFAYRPGLEERLREGARAWRSG